MTNLEKDFGFGIYVLYTDGRSRKVSANLTLYLKQTMIVAVLPAPSRYGFYSNTEI